MRYYVNLSVRSSVRPPIGQGLFLTLTFWQIFLFCIFMYFREKWFEIAYRQTFLNTNLIDIRNDNLFYAFSKDGLIYNSFWICINIRVYIRTSFQQCCYFFVMALC